MFLRVLFYLNNFPISSFEQMSERLIDALRFAEHTHRSKTQLGPRLWEEAPSN